MSRNRGYKLKIILLAGLMAFSVGCTSTNEIQLKDDLTKPIPKISSDSEQSQQIKEFNNLRIYQIMVGSYRDGKEGGYGIGYGPSHHNGDIKGIIDSLDYIDSLGVNAIWLTPIFESKASEEHDEFEERGRTTGYFADDYYNIDPNFGTNEEFKQLVDKAHEKGLYVILDGVFGHHGSYPIEGVVDGKEQWYGSEVKYPESLEYFKDVATYWIEEYEIDGWRLDQVYQLVQDGNNYQKDIREAVEEVANKRRAEGKEWGTLGYIVGEIWDEVGTDIINRGYSSDGLRSYFNFPLRYALVRALAVDENSRDGYLEGLDMAYSMNYPSYSQQNLFLTNHDLIRFGDLLQFAGLQDEYYERHKMALSFLASYSGPITLYYGDEYGDEYDKLENNKYDLKGLQYIAEDNVARSEGKIDDFSKEESDLIEYTKNIMKIRQENSALYNGERTNLLIEDNVYVDLKTDKDNKVLYILNISSDEEVVEIKESDIGDNKLVNLETGETIKSQKGKFQIKVDKLSGSFLRTE